LWAVVCWSGEGGGHSAAPALLSLSMRLRRAVEHEQEGRPAGGAGVRGGLRAHLRLQLRARRPGQLLHPRHPVHRKVPCDVPGARCRPGHTRAHGARTPAPGRAAAAHMHAPCRLQPAAAAVPWWSCRRSKGGGRGLDARLLVCRGSPAARVAGLVNTALPRGVAPQQPRTPAEGKPSGVQQEICFYSTVAARPSYHHAGPACIAEPCWLPET